VSSLPCNLKRSSKHQSELVLPLSQVPVSYLVDSLCPIFLTPPSSAIKLRSMSNPSSLISQLSSRAFSVLTNKVPALLDLLFSDDKDRVASVFVGVVHALLPFLKKPTLSLIHANLSIGLIAALCDYPYCLRAWRKEVLDIFNDQEFFLFDHEAIGSWKKVINHLMVKDKTAFADVMSM
jgi:hypothetical protein